MTIKTLHPGKLSLYTVLSISDLFLTHRLIQQNGGLFYESNPIANAWLSAYGWAGLATFKVAAMSLVAVMAAYISLRRPRAGAYVLRFACCAVAAVVLYSCWLAGSFGVQPATANSLSVIQPSANKVGPPRLSAAACQLKHRFSGCRLADPVDESFFDVRERETALLTNDQE